jgi:sodium transport system ATP-binding protein
MRLLDEFYLRSSLERSGKPLITCDRGQQRASELPASRVTGCKFLDAVETIWGVIQTDGLQKSFAGRNAVNGLTFSAANGAITGLVGPNGSGKTTTLRLITGLLHPDGGQALVDGIDPSRDPIGARRRIGALTDGLGNYPRLTTREHLRYFGELRGMPAQEIEARTQHLLNLFEMHEIADRRAQGFSQGERMKLALARAVINDPPNILLDEPANGLDVASVRALRTLLDGFRDAGKCVLLSSHMMAEVATVCDAVVVVARGKVVAQGSPAELVRSSKARSLEEAFVELTT